MLDRGPRDVLLLAIGGGGATWIEATYDGARYSDIALMRAELPAGTPRKVTSLASVSLEPLLTTDKLAALLECAPTKDVCDLLIVELATGALTRIGQPGKGHYWEVLGAMSDDTLYVGDSPDRPNGHHGAQRVFALDLAERDALAKQWPP